MFVYLTKNNYDFFFCSSFGEDTRLFSGQNIDVLIHVKDDCVVNYIEHIEVLMNIRYDRRGALEIYLVSPQGEVLVIYGSLVVYLV